MKLKQLTLITLITLTIAALPNIQNTYVKASPTAQVYIEPTPVTQPPGQNFTVAIKIADCPKIYAWYINLTWNPTILKLVGIAEGSFLNQGGTRNTDFIYINLTLANMWGYIRFGCALKGEPSSAQVGGSGTLATLTFNVLDEGETPLHFIYVKLYDYWFTRKEYTATDGLFKFPIYRISIQPEYIHQLLQAGEKFNISIAAFVKELYSWNATVSWDPTIINATRIFEGPFLSIDGTQATQFNYEIFENYTIINGTILGGKPVNSTFENPETLAIIEFEVKAIGMSSIIFKNVHFLDINGESILVIPVNGEFNNLWQDIKVEVSVSEVNIKPGQNVTITVMVKNMGNLPATFEVRVYAGPLGLTLIGSKTLSLNPDENVTLHFYWDTSGCEGGQYKIRVLADPLLYEDNVGDNIALAELSIESSSQIPMEIIATAIIIIVVVVLVAVLIFKRKRKGKS